MADIIRQIYYGRYITADIFRRIHYGRYIAYNKNGHISTNVQRQKLSIAASESFRCNASPQRLPWAVLSCIRRERSPFSSATGPLRGDPRFQEGVDAHGGKESAHKAQRPGYPHTLYIYIYAYIYIYMYTYIYRQDSGAKRRAALAASQRR